MASPKDDNKMVDRRGNVLKEYPKKIIKDGVKTIVKNAKEEEALGLEKVKEPTKKNGF